MTPMEMLFLIFGIFTAAMSVLASAASRALRREALKEHRDYEPGALRWAPAMLIFGAALVTLALTGTIPQWFMP